MGPQKHWPCDLYFRDFDISAVEDTYEQHISVYISGSRLPFVAPHNALYVQVRAGFCVRVFVSIFSLAADSIPNHLYTHFLESSATLFANRGVIFLLATLGRNFEGGMESLESSTTRKSYRVCEQERIPINREIAVRVFVSMRKI